MPLEPCFLNDNLENLVRKCIVFPADGEETRIAHMIARTVTVEDPSLLHLYSRCVDMASTFGDDYRKTRVTAHRSIQNGIQSTYLFFYNLSPNLPINLNVAHVVGVTPSHLKSKKRLFWRGDLVAMKAQPESEVIDFMVQSLDADLLELGSLEEFLRETYREGTFERLLDSEEWQWDWYLRDYCGPGSLLGARKSYWGSNATEKEENFLSDLNELRCAIGRPPLPRHAYMKSYTEHAATLYSAFKSALRLDRKVTGPPKFPPELERQIFETCALESPEVCTVLVLVAKRVHEWIDPILIKTIFIMWDFESKRRDQLELFLARLTNGRKPVEYYAQHIKNLAMSGIFSENKVMKGILDICTGVENLVLFGSRASDFFENPQAGRSLRRLTLKLENFSFNGSMPNFYHPCFTNLTHLHLYDEEDDWSYYAGWETLVNLTHLALACAGPAETKRVMQMLPAIRYVALGSYRGGQRYKYAEVMVNNSPHIRAAWSVRAVFLSEIPQYDWERGARGEGDFWDVVEEEVERRLEEGLVD